MSNIPAISGNELIKLLKKDGWEDVRSANHGLALKKKFDDKTRVTVVPQKNDSLPEGTLQAILSTKQTGITKKGLLKLIEKYGI